MNSGIGKAVNKSTIHTIAKMNVESINLLKALGVKGDAHMRKTVKHGSRVKKIRINLI